MITNDQFTRCPKCKTIDTTIHLRRLLWVCSRCHYHFPLSANERLAQIADPDSFTEISAGICAVDLLEFPDYPAKLAAAKEKTGLNCAVLTGVAAVETKPVALAIFDFYFIGGTMGGAEGEKLARLFEHAAASDLPTVVFLASGGMRMQEGINSLMQMAKTVACLSRIKDKSLPYLVVFTDPAYGGATASFASVPYGRKIAEPKARIGFAGPEVVRTIYPRDVEKLRGIQIPEEKLYPFLDGERPQIDLILPRLGLRRYIASFLRESVSEAG